MKKLVIIFTAILIFLMNVSTTYAQPLKLGDESSILIDSKSGQVLFEYNSDKKGLYPASTTKIMTAAIAIENGDLKKMMTASEAAVNDIGKDGMNIGIMPGEELSLEDLLHALLISSANETANIIAENISSTRQEFVDLMNKKARELGAVNTHFVNPCGAHNKDHYTTAGDLAKIARYAMTFPEFRKIVSQTQYQLSPTNKHSEWPVLYTTNRLMRYTKSDIYTLNGIKTGYTGPAGYNLISSAVNEDGMDLIAVVMDVKSPGARDDVNRISESLLEYGFQNYSLEKVLSANATIKSVPVIDAKDDAKLDLIAKSDLTCVLPIEKDNWNLEKSVHINPNIKAPLKQGDALGYIEYKRDGVSLGKVDLAASKSVDAAVSKQLINTVKNATAATASKGVVTGLIIALFVFLLLRLTLKKISRGIRFKRY